MEWHKNSENIAKTLQVLEKLAQRYKNYPNLAGIELLNEPHWDVPFDILLDYYKAGHDIVRKHCREQTAVIVSDAFRPYDFKNAFTESKYKNVWLDSHLYQVFDKKDKKLDVNGHLKKTKTQWRDIIETLQQNVPVIIGEWSAALDAESLKGLDEQAKNDATRAYAAAQLEVFENAKGWFYWTYKTEDQSTWNFKYACLEGLLPNKY